MTSFIIRKANDACFEYNTVSGFQTKLPTDYLSDITAMLKPPPDSTIQRKIY